MPHLPHPLTVNADGQILKSNALQTGYFAPGEGAQELLDGVAVRGRRAAFLKAVAAVVEGVVLCGLNLL